MNIHDCGKISDLQIVLVSTVNAYLKAMIMKMHEVDES